LAQIDRLDALARLLPANRRRLLDIGSGPGFFVKTAQEQGWKAEGIEPSRQAATHARDMGLTITEGFFGRETAKHLGPFDAVHMNNMLEHVPNPVALVQAARDLLEPGGALCVGVPNDFSPLQNAAAASGLAQWWIAPPHHLNYFDFDSLTRLLTRLGLRVAERHTSFPMEAFLLMGDDYTADPALGRACHNRRKRFDLALEHAGLGQLRRRFYCALAELGLGREAVVIAVKD
jgi:SAM-dependent methyltransferase